MKSKFLFRFIQISRFPYDFDVFTFHSRNLIDLFNLYDMFSQ